MNNSSSQKLKEAYRIWQTHCWFNPNLGSFHEKQGSRPSKPQRAIQWAVLPRGLCFIFCLLVPALISCPGFPFMVGKKKGKVRVNPFCENEKQNQSFHLLFVVPIAYWQTWLPCVRFYQWEAAYKIQLTFSFCPSSVIWSPGAHENTLWELSPIVVLFPTEGIPLAFYLENTICYFPAINSCLWLKDDHKIDRNKSHLTCPNLSPQSLQLGSHM